MQKGSVQGLETPSELLDLVQPHIESYDYFLGEGIQRVVEHIDPIEVSREADVELNNPRKSTAEAKPAAG